MMKRKRGRPRKNPEIDVSSPGSQRRRTNTEETERNKESSSSSPRQETTETINNQTSLLPDPESTIQDTEQTIRRYQKSPEPVQEPEENNNKNVNNSSHASNNNNNLKRKRGRPRKNSSVRPEENLVFSGPSEPLTDASSLSLVLDDLKQMLRVQTSLILDLKKEFRELNDTGMSSLEEGSS
eukprot:TRINITY_DN5290_c0_g1_i1.p1 TRINITY_DN5290_c0_g1~~TRINITY_DN5290_c0_g1_i1.p1  ORF type:complete len:182 (+),score=40.43 TRINITY_DN5290_c0_g1_i1:146-691(+)